MAGRPTSSELALLEKKRDSLEIERRLKHKRTGVETPDTAMVAVADTTAGAAVAEVASVESPVAGLSADSPAPAQEPAVEPVTDASQIQALKAASGTTFLRNISRFRGSKQASELFYIIAGTFKEAENAERYAVRLQKGAFPQAQALTLGNGYILTAVYAGDQAEETLRFLSEHQAELPSEAWILINDLR